MSQLASLASQTNQLGFEVLAQIGVGGQLDGFVELNPRKPFKQACTGSARAQTKVSSLGSR